MTMEEALAAIQQIQDVWEVFTKSMLDAAQAISDLFKDLYESSEAGYGHAGMSPKQYGMPLQKRPQKCVRRYRLVRTAPRNRPYQRRLY